MLLLTVSEAFLCPQASAFCKTLVTRKFHAGKCMNSVRQTTNLAWCRQNKIDYYSFTRRMMSTSPASANSIDKPITNFKGLLNEINRLQYRTFKKIENANTRIAKFGDGFDPDKFTAQKDLQELRDKAALINQLLELANAESKLTDEIVMKAKALGLTDETPASQPRVKAKQVHVPIPATRLPYHKFRSIEGIEIMVGRSAVDNDNLSTNPELRSGMDWWLHVGDSAGSHVVICNQDDNLPTKHKQTLVDAALLAAVNSKVGNASRATVHFTRCKHVKKPAGAKPGMVQLNGPIYEIKIDIKAEKPRLDRLMLTKDK